MPSGNKKRKKGESSSNSPPVFAWVTVGTGERYVTVTDPFILKKIEEEGPSGWKLDDVGRDEEIEIKWDNNTKEKVSVMRVRIVNSSTSSRTTRGSTSRTAQGSSSRTTRGGSTRSNSSSMKQKCDMPGCKYTQKEQFDSDYNDEIYCSQHCKKKADAAKEKELDEDITAANKRKKKTKKKQTGERGRPKQKRNDDSDYDDMNNISSSSSSLSSDDGRSLLSTPPATNKKKKKPKKTTSAVVASKKKASRSVAPLPEKVNETLPLTLRVGIATKNTTKQKKFVWPSANIGYVDHFHTSKLTTHSSYDDMVGVIKALVGNMHVLTANSEGVSILYDGETISASPKNRLLRDIKSNKKLVPISSNEELWQAVATKGIKIKSDEVPDDCTIADINVVSDFDHLVSHYYHLDVLIIVAPPTAATTTTPTKNKKIPKSIEVTVMPLTIRSKLSNNVDDAEDDDSGGGGNDGTDTAYCLSSKDKPHGTLNLIDHEAIGTSTRLGHLRHLMLEKYPASGDNNSKGIGQKSSLFIRLNKTSYKMVRIKRTYDLTQHIESILKRQQPPYKDSKAKDKVLQLQLSVGKIAQDDRQLVEKDVVATDDEELIGASQQSLGSPRFQQHNPISGTKEGSKKASRRNDGTVERIFKLLYESSDSPFYHKLCWEHRTCIIHRWGNGGQERDKVVRELDEEPPVFPDLRWISACIGMKDLIPGVIEYPPTVSGDPPRAKSAGTNNDSFDERIINSSEKLAGAIAGLASSGGGSGRDVAAVAADSVRFIRRNDAEYVFETTVYMTDMNVNESTGKDLLEAAVQAANTERSSIFKFDQNTLADIRRGSKVIRYEYRKKNPASDAFKKLSLSSILGDQNETVQIIMTVNENVFNETDGNAF